MLFLEEFIVTEARNSLSWNPKVDIRTCNDLQFCLLFCTGVKLDASPKVKTYVQIV